MIKFFRKIRYDLMGKNKTGKYLKYAIGEIILVVVGILIALSINNWNENQKLKVKELSVYKELRSELTESRKDALGDLSDIERNQKSSSIVLNIIVSKKFNMDTLRNHLPYTYDIELFSPPTSAFESLKSIGFDVLSNDSLRLAISNLYQLTMPSLYQSGASVEYAKFRKKILPLLEPHLSIDRDRILNDSKMDELTFRSELKYATINNPQAFINDELLLLNIQSSLFWRNRVIRQHARVAKTIEKITQMIDSEIELLE